MADTTLPEGFQELERFVDKWDRVGTNARYQERLASSMPELESFHAAIGDSLPQIKTLLDSINFEDYDDSHRRLARLVFAWVPVAEAVEVFKQPRVPDSKMYWDVQVEPDM